MNHYRWYHVYVTKTKGERDSDCAEFFLHNTPIPYKSSAENTIIAARELAYALQNPATQAPFTNIGKSQLVAIEQLSKIFTKAADDRKSTAYPPHKQADHTAAGILKTLHPRRTKYIPSPQPNVIEDEEGLIPANFQHKVHRFPSGPHIIPPEVPNPSPRVNTAQPQKVDMGGPSYNFRSRDNKNPRPQYALTAQHQTPRKANSVTHHILGVDQEYRHLIKGPDRKNWERSFANKLGQLAQGIRSFKGTNMVMLIPKFKVPKDKKVTYGKIVCEMKQEKGRKERTRLTVGGKVLDFTGNISAPTASVITAKCDFTCVVSTPGERCLLAYMKHFYLNNILPFPECMRIPLKIIPQDIIGTYDLKALVDKQGWIYMRIKKGMFSLKQAGIIAYQ